MKNILMLLFAFATVISAQFEPPKVSPHAQVSQTFGFTSVTIDYHRPSVRGRKIWDGLVPYNKVWRTGANDATTIQFTTDVTIEGNKIPAGIYSLFTIPNESEWTIILNNQTKISGLDYNAEFDFVRFKVKPAQGRFVEQLLFTFCEVTDASCYVILNWENVQLAIKVESDLNNQAILKMKEAIAAKPQDPTVYNDCIKYAADKEIFLDEAIKWADKAIVYGGGYISYYLKARILYAQQKFNDALKTLDTCREKGRTEKNYDSMVGLLDLLEKQIKSKLK